MEQKNNSGALFSNKKQDAKPNAPDYTGSITIDGKKFILSGWVNKSKEGKSYLRLLVAEPTEKPVNDLPF